MDINNQIKDNKKKIIIAIITFMYVLSPLLLINKTTFSIEDNPYENQNLSETDTLENAFVIECDKTNLSPSEPTTCSIKGKNFTKQVSSVSAKLKLGENLTLTNIIFDAIWVGDESLDGKIDIYTDINKYGDFNIGTFTIQSSNVNTGIDTNITLEDIVISD